MAQSNVRVEAYAGYKGEETPRAFIYGGVRYEVQDIISLWYTETHACFRVRASDGNLYILRCEQNDLVWELVMQETRRT
jgi:hypothetical protein